jgi:uncharacterized protein
MNIYAIADLHLAIGDPNKSMEVFGNNWKDYHEKILANWKATISPDDLVLIPGDICWSMHLNEAILDMQWIDALPGKKILIKGNHDYWWSSLSKVKKALPPSIDVIQNNAITVGDISIAGTRLWDSYEYNFNSIIQYQETSLVKQEKTTKEEEEKIFLREMQRLEMSLSHLDPSSNVKIVMTHYPPIGLDMTSSRASKLLEQYNVDICVFGHLHNVKKDIKIFGLRNNIKYYFVSSDYLNFSPKQIFP